MDSIFQFERVDDADLHVWVIGTTETPEPLWPGLFSEWPEDEELNPYFRYGINNNDGEYHYLRRLMAWGLTAGLSRYAIPTWWRDEAASNLGVDRPAIPLVRWQYKVDPILHNFVEADRGFVEARSTWTVSPRLDLWELAHRNRAGLFPLASCTDLTQAYLAVCFDAFSEITLFGLGGGQTGDELRRRLDGHRRPRLQSVLCPGDVFVDLTVNHDLTGGKDYLTVKSHEPLDDRVHRVATTARYVWQNYTSRLPSLTSMEDFHTAIADLSRHFLD